MLDRPVTLRDLIAMLERAREYNRRHGMMMSRADGTIGEMIDTLNELAAMPETQTFVLEDRIGTHPSRLMLPIHPIREVTAIIDASGTPVPLEHVLVDTQLASIRYAGNRDFTVHPYRVTVTV